MKSPVIIEHEINEALRACATQARAAWPFLRFQMQIVSKRKGHLQRDGKPLTPEQIARLADCPAESAAQTLQEFSSVGLLRVGSDSSWFSPPLVQMENDRANGRIRAKLSRERPQGEPSPDVTPMSQPRAKPPSSHSSRGEKKEIAAQSKLAFASNADEAAAGEAKKDSATRSRKKRTPEEWRVFHQCKQRFCELHWPKHHDGQVYDFDSDNGTVCSANHSGLWSLLNDDAIAGDPARADQVMDYFAYFCSVQRPRWSSPLHMLGKKAGHYWQKSQLPRSSYAIGNTSNGEVHTVNSRRPGEFEQSIDIPILHPKAAG